MVVLVMMMEASQQILVKCNNNSNNIITNHPTPVSQALARRQLWLPRRRWHINNKLLNYHHLNYPNSHPKVPAPESNQRPDVAKVFSISKWLLELAYPFALLAKPKFGQLI
jgi:hypothetical protein